MEETHDNTSENKPLRDERGRLLPGNTANPNGRPEGSISIVAEIKKKLLEVPEGKQKNYLQLLVDRILYKAITDGDSRTIKQLLNYIDGMPKLEFGGKIEGVGIDVAELVKIIKQLNDGNRDNSKEPPIL